MPSSSLGLGAIVLSTSGALVATATVFGVRY
jgi:hypothetical protein